MYIWDVNELKQQIGKIFQLNRLRKELSQLQLGNELNLSSNHIGRIERAETNPTIEIILKFSNFFEIDILTLFTKLSKEDYNKVENEIEILKKEFQNKNKKKS